MPRAPLNVLVYPYLQVSEGMFEYALLRRADVGWWQGVTGGGEDDETPLQAAQRETFEETGIQGSTFLRLDTVISVRVTYFSLSHIWGDDVYVIPMVCYGVRAPDRQLSTVRQNAHQGRLQGRRRRIRRRSAPACRK